MALHSWFTAQCARVQLDFCKIYTASLVTFTAPAAIHPRRWRELPEISLASLQAMNGPPLAVVVSSTPEGGDYGSFGDGDS
jgi:hypothetical protein